MSSGFRVGRLSVRDEHTSGAEQNTLAIVRVFHFALSLHSGGTYDGQLVEADLCAQFRNHEYSNPPTPSLHLPAHPSPDPKL